MSTTPGPASKPETIGGRIWRLVAKAGNQTPVLVLDTGYNVNAFGQDDAGNIYVVTSGKLFKIGL